MRLHSRPKRTQPRRACALALGPGEDGDPPVPVFDEVLHEQLDAALVVEQDGAVAGVVDVARAETVSSKTARDIPVVATRSPST